MSCLDLLRLDMRLLHMHVQVVKMLGNLNPFQLVLIRAVSSHNMEVSQRRMVSVTNSVLVVLPAYMHALINFPESILSYRSTVRTYITVTGTGGFNCAESVQAINETCCLNNLSASWEPGRHLMVILISQEDSIVNKLLHLPLPCS